MVLALGSSDLFVTDMQWLGCPGWPVSVAASGSETGTSFDSTEFTKVPSRANSPWQATKLPKPGGVAVSLRRGIVLVLLDSFGEPKSLDSPSPVEPV